MNVRWVWSGASKQHIRIRFENHSGKRLMVSGMKFIVGTAAYGQFVHITSLNLTFQHWGTNWQQRLWIQSGPATVCFHRITSSSSWPTRWIDTLPRSSRDVTDLDDYAHRYRNSRSNSTRSPASAAGYFSESRLMLQVWENARSRVRVGQCSCSRSEGGASNSAYVNSRFHVTEVGGP